MRGEETGDRRQETEEKTEDGRGEETGQDHRGR